MSASIDTGLSQAYDSQYEDQRMAGWRELGAKFKARNIIDITAGRKFDKVIEVGAGDGSILQKLSQSSFASSYFAVEISNSGLEQIKKKNIAGLKDALLFDGYKIPYPDKFFDLAVLSHVLEHVEYERTLLRELKRISKNQVIEVPRDYVFNVDKKVDHFLSYGHINVYTPSSLRFLLKTEGFKILNQKLSLVSGEILRYNPDNAPRSAVQKLKIELTHLAKSFLFGLPFQSYKERYTGNITLFLEGGDSKIKIF